MRFVDLLNKFTGFVDLGKFLVDAGAGTVLAVAFAILAANYADVPILPVDQGSELDYRDAEGLSLGQIVALTDDTGILDPDRLEKALQSCLDRELILTLESKAAKTDDPSPSRSETQEGEAETNEGNEEAPRCINRNNSSSYSRRLERLRRKTARVENQHACRESVAAVIRQELDQIAKERATRKEARDEDAQYRNQLEAATVRHLEKETWTTGQVASRLETLRERPEEEASSKQLEAALERNEKLLELQSAANQKKIDRLVELRTALEKQKVEDFTSLLEILLDHLLGLAILGWVLGTLMNPLSRVFLGTKATGEKVFKRNRVFQEGFCCSEGLHSDQQEEIKKLVKNHEVSYFVGKKVVTQLELNELVNTYYRWAEVCTNMVFPSFLLGWAILHWLVPGFGKPGISIITGLTIALVVIVVLYFVRRGGGDGENRLPESTASAGAVGASLILCVLLVNSCAPVGQREQLPWILAVGVATLLLPAFFWFRGHKAYETYLLRVFEFLCGRLEQLALAQKKQEEKQESDLQATVSEVVRKSEEYIKKLRQRIERLELG